MQKLKPLQQVLICLVGLTILIVSLAIAVFFYKRKARSLKPRSSTELSNNQELSSDDSSSQHSRDPYTMKAPPALPQPEDSPPTNIPDGWMKFAQPTLRLKYNAPPTALDKIEAETAGTHLEIGLERDSLRSSDARTRDSAALELLENIVHQQALASASIHHNFEQFIHSVIWNFFTAVDTRIPSIFKKKSIENSLLSPIINNGTLFTSYSTLVSSTDISADQFRNIIENYGQDHSDLGIGILIAYLEDDKKKYSVDSFNRAELKTMFYQSETNSLLARILLKALENSDPALKGYIKVKPNLYIRYSLEESDNKKALRCQHLWFLQGNKGILKVIGRRPKRDINAWHKQWIEECTKKTLEVNTLDKNFGLILCTGPNYQGNNPYDNDALHLYHPKAFEQSECYGLSNIASSPYTIFPWFLAYCSKACEILQSVKSPAELAFSSFAPLREITNAILRGETIYAEQFISKPQKLALNSVDGKDLDVEISLIV